MSGIARWHRAAMMLAVLGCSTPGEGGSGNGGSVEGTWSVVSVNGQTPPVLLPTVRGCALTGLSGTLVNRADGRFSASYSYRRQCNNLGQTIDRVISGRYTVNGNTLSFAADSGFSKFVTAPLVSGTLSGGIIVAQSTPAPGQTVTVTLGRR
jgi:hypothetical protein